MSTQDALSFFRAWMAQPRLVGAISPSGTPLTRLMTSEITEDTGKVIELGPGTGVVTCALLDRGVKQEDLALVEYASDFARLLQLRFPHARVLWMDAARLTYYDLFEAASVGAVVSGLPLLNMTPRKIIAILQGAFVCLRPGGSYYQFTYGPWCPVSRPVLDRLGLKATCIGKAMLNVPPATVYRISRRRPPKPAQARAAADCPVPVA